MTTNVSSASFLSTSENFSEDRSQFLIQLTNLYSTMATAINSKEIGQFYTTQQLTGQQFPTVPVSQRYRPSYRKIFFIGAVAAGATLNTAHGITGITLPTHLYGAVITATPDYRPVPYASVTAANAGIELRADNTNVILINGAAAPNITSGVLVFEYLLS